MKNANIVYTFSKFSCSKNVAKYFTKQFHQVYKYILLMKSDTISAHYSYRHTPCNGYLNLHIQVRATLKINYYLTYEHCIAIWMTERTAKYTRKQVQYLHDNCNIYYKPDFAIKNNCVLNLIIEKCFIDRPRHIQKKTVIYQHE